MLWLLASAKRFGGAGHAEAEDRRQKTEDRRQNTEYRMQNAVLGTPYGEQFSILTPRLCSGQASNF